MSDGSFRHRSPERPLPALPTPPRGSAPPTLSPRQRRLRAPLLVLLWGLLGLEAVGGLWIFFMRLASGQAPGEALHVGAGAALTLVYVAYQWPHWTRVAPWRNRLHYALGLIAALSMLAALATGYALAWPWWQVRMTAHDAGAVPYPTAMRAAHNIMSMLVLTFAGAHFAAVRPRDPAASRR